MLPWLLPAILYSVCTNGDAGIVIGGTADAVFGDCVLEVLILYSFRVVFCLFVCFCLTIFFTSYILALLYYFSWW